MDTIFENGWMIGWLLIVILTAGILSSLTDRKVWNTIGALVQYGALVGLIVYAVMINAELLELLVIVLVVALICMLPLGRLAKMMEAGKGDKNV